MEKKVYYRNTYEGGIYNGAVRRYGDKVKAVRYARQYITRMSRNPLCSSEDVCVRVSTMVNYREVDYVYLNSCE